MHGNMKKIPLAAVEIVCRTLKNHKGLEASKAQISETESWQAAF